MTHRQFKAWEAWLELELDRPGKTEQYLMMIAAEVRRVLAKHPQSIKISDFRLEFSRPKPLSREEATKASFTTWLGALGGSNVQIRGPNGQILEDVDPYWVVDESTTN